MISPNRWVALFVVCTLVAPICRAALVSELPYCNQIEDLGFCALQEFPVLTAATTCLLKSSTCTPAEIASICVHTNLVAFTTCTAKTRGCFAYNQRTCQAFLAAVTPCNETTMMTACAVQDATLAAAAAQATVLSPTSNRLRGLAACHDCFEFEVIYDLAVSGFISSMGSYGNRPFVNRVVANGDPTAFIASTRAFLSTGDFKWVITPSRLLKQLVTEFPNVNFTFSEVGIPVTGPNVNQLSFKTASLGYIAGAAMGRQTATKRIAFLYNRTLAWFARSVFIGVVVGAQRVCPDCTFHVLRDDEAPAAIAAANIDAAVTFDRVSYQAIHDAELFTFGVGLDPLLNPPYAANTSSVASGRVVGSFNGVLTTVLRLLGTQITQKFDGVVLVSDLTVPGVLDVTKNNNWTQSHAAMTDAADNVNSNVNFNTQADAYGRLLLRPAMVQSKNKVAEVLQYTGETLPVAADNVAVLIGGNAVAILSPANPTAVHTLLLDMNYGHAVNASGSIPAARSMAAFAHDATDPEAAGGTHARLYMVMGQSIATSAILADVWVLSAGAQAPLQMSWALLPTTGTPSGRIGHSVTKVHNSLYMFGGRSSVGGAALADLWKLDLATLAWSEVSHALSPRAGQVGVYVSLAAPLTVNTVSDTEWLAFVLADGATVDTSVELFALTAGVALQLGGETTAAGNAAATVINRDAGRCVVGAAGHIWVLGGKTYSNSPNANVCKFSLNTLHWQCYEDTSIAFDTLSCVPACGSSPTRVPLVLLSNSTLHVWTDIDADCNSDESNTILDDLGWNCVACPNTTYAHAGGCVPCATGALAARRSWCIAAQVDTTPYVAGIIVAGIVSAIVLAVLGRKMQNTLVTEAHVEELVEAIVVAVATGDVDPVMFITEIPRPSRLERSLAHILQVFEAYRQFMPTWVFDGNREELDVSAPHMTLGGSNDSANEGDAVIPAAEMMIHRACVLHNRFTWTVVTVISVAVHTVPLKEGRAEDQEQRLMDVLENMMSAVYGVAESYEGLVDAVIGDHAVITFNGLLHNDHHESDGALSACVLIEALRSPYTRAEIGVASGEARVGVIDGLFGQRCVTLGQVMSTAAELAVANAYHGTTALLDWDMHEILAGRFAMRLLGYWRTDRGRRLVAELCGTTQAQMDELDREAEESGAQVCVQDYEPRNELLMTLVEADADQIEKRAVLLQQINWQTSVSEFGRLRELVAGGVLPEKSQETSQPVNFPQ
jgi:hypothetical protein